MSNRKWKQRDVKSVVVKTAQVRRESKIVHEMLRFTIETAVGGHEGRMCRTGGCRAGAGAGAGRVRGILVLARNGRRVQRLLTRQQCAAYFWGMQLQIARRIGRRVHNSRKGKQSAAYYWGMQLQIPRCIGRRVQRSRQGKQCAAYYWGM